MPIGTWATVAEAATHFKLTRQRIHQLIRSGLLGECRRAPTPRGPVWLVPYPFKRAAGISGHHRAGCDCGRHRGDRGGVRDETKRGAGGQGRDD